MTKRSSLCLTVLIAYTCSTTTLSAQAKKVWAQEPESFHGVAFLGTESELRAKFTLINGSSCNVEQPSDDKLCVFHLDIAGVEITGLTILAEEDKFVSVAGVFPASKASVIRDVFYEKYGKPLFVKSEEKQWPGKRVFLYFRETARTGDKNLIERIAERLYAEQLSSASQQYSRNLDSAQRRYELTAAGEMEILTRLHGPKKTYDEQMKAADHLFRDRQKQAKEDVERANTEAKEDLERFKAGTYGVFSLETNEYRDAVRKRLDAQKKSGAGVL